MLGRQIQPAISGQDHSSKLSSGIVACTNYLWSEALHHAGITCDIQMLMVSASLGLLALCADVNLSLVNSPHPQYAKHSVCDSL